MKRTILLLVICIQLAIKIQAQVNTYSFWSYWGVYNELASGNILGSGSGLDDDSYNAIDIGFPFTYNGNTFTQISINANGFLALGSSVTSTYAAISLGATNNVISPFSENLVGNANASISYSLEGNPGNRVLTIQWKDFHRGTSTNQHFSFQAKLFESTNEICFVYGEFLTNTSITSQVGIRGNSSNDFHNRTTTNNWASTFAGGTNTGTCMVANSTLPIIGQTFCFTPTIAGFPLIPTTPAPLNNSSNNSLTISLSWSFGANSSTYDLWFGPKGNMVKVIDNTTVSGISGSFAASGLNQSTTYQWQVVERNSNGTLKGPVWSFTTECGTYSVPFTENFDSYSPPQVGCGTIVNANNDAVKWESKMGLAYSGISRLRIGYNPAGQNHNDWYFTPGLVLTGLQSYEVKFYYKGGSSIYIENLEVKWGNSASPSAMVPDPIFSDIGFYKPNYLLATSTFTPDASGVYYIGWHCFSMGDQIEVSVDQISVTLTTSCTSPSNLSAGPVGSTTATIGWNNSGSPSRLIYGTPGFDPGSGTGTLVSTSANEYTLTSLLPGTTYSVYVQNQCSNGIFSGWSGPLNFTTENSNKTLNLSLLLEGLYNGNGQMSKAQNGNGNQFPGTTAEQIIVELHSPSDYNNIVYQSSPVNLSITGDASVTNIPGNINGACYITVKQRNSIETVSSVPVSFSSSTVSYQFDNPSKAFGNNLAQSGSYFLIHGGDENQDGLVDSSDLNAADNNAAAFATGYIASDVNGDGLVDSSDLNLIDNNASAFVSKITP